MLYLDINPPSINISIFQMCINLNLLQALEINEQNVVKSYELILWIDVWHDKIFAARRISWRSFKNNFNPSLIQMRSLTDRISRKKMDKNMFEDRIAAFKYIFVIKKKKIVLRALENSSYVCLTFLFDYLIYLS